MKWLRLPARWMIRHFGDVAAGRQMCKVCGQTQEVDFVVANDTWEAVVPIRWDGRVVCLRCFERFAARRGLFTVRVFLPGGP